MKSLFQLIASLDKGEKRYIKIYSSRHIIMGNSNDMELFDAISKLQNPTDESLKAVLGDSKIVKHLSLYKHILYKNLLRCLNSYHTGKNIEDEILDLYKSSRVLYNKCLYNDAKKLIKKARKLALDNESLGLYSFLREAETQIQERQFDLQEFKESILDSADEQREQTKKTIEYLQLRQISNEIYYQSRIWGVVDEELSNRHSPQKALAEFEKINKSLQSDRAKMLAWKVSSLLACGKQDFKSSTEHELKILKTLEGKPDDYPGKTEEILVTLHRISWNYYVLRDHKKLDKILQRIRKMDDASSSIALIKFQLFINYELLAKVNQNHGPSADELEKKIEGFYATSSHALGAQRMLIINYNLAILFFVEGNFQKCEKWLNRVLENVNKKVHTDILISSRLLQLTLKYEMGLYPLIKYVALSTKRYIKKLRPLKGFEMQLFNTLIKLSSTKDELKRKKILMKFHEDMVEYKKQAKPLDIAFSFELWAKSKITNVPLRKVFDKEVRH
ncbi:MAG: hypothetical protein IPN22_06695 [Bacteroidetes bacterium]|nr:hypothetical protein [Bacteroidota bacterium]